jgi:recombination associated protein RdgC
MGFLSGRVAFARFRVSGAALRGFSAEKIEKLSALAFGSQRLASADGVEVGWTAGDHILDSAFDLEKNVIADALHFAFRIDTEKPPADLLHAYAALELQGAAAINPSARDKREARAAARDRLEREARDGRYTRRKVFDVLWDGPSNELLVSTTAVSVIDRLHAHFQKTFGRKFEPITAGSLAFTLAEARRQTRGVDDARPSAFVPSLATGDVAWVLGDSSRDFLGNEFLLWLWFRTDSEQETLPLSDGSDVAIMPARTLTLECPRGQTGKESITSEGPTRLPEAMRAVQAGKLPRKCGLTLLRHDATVELTLHAETLAVTGAKLPPCEETGRFAVEERIGQVRSLIETLDLMYDAFGNVRCGSAWAKELAQMQKWLARGE